MKFILGYFCIGLIWLVLAFFINKKLNLKLFWEYDPWLGWNRNGFEFAIVLGWIFVVPIAAIAGLIYLFHRIIAPFIGQKPLEQETGNDLYNYLLSEGFKEIDATAIVKEIEENIDE